MATPNPNVSSAPILRPVEIPSPFELLRSFWQSDMAMDLGTANTLVYVKNRGIVLNEPSVLAIDEASGAVRAFGHAAKDISGKTSQAVRCVRPLKDGVIADFKMTSAMITHMLKDVRQKLGIARVAFNSPRLVIGIPSSISNIEKRAVTEAALAAGVREVILVDEPIAAALGADLPIEKPIGNMIVDIGGGTTEVAVVSLNGTIYSHSIRVAGDEMDEAVQRRIKKVFGLDVGIFEAERIKIMLGSALPLGHKKKMSIFGRDGSSSMPHQVEIDDELVRDSIQEALTAITESIMRALEQASPEVAQDVFSRGIYIAGGGALLRGFAERLQRETGIKFIRVQDPLSCVVRGAGRIVDNLREMRGLCAG